MTAPSENQLIREQVDRIVDRGVLGRSRFYTALLEYLADCAERGHTPKEVEIAADVFDRGDGFDPTQDSMVRVYAHNLRRKLDQYYADDGASEPVRISLPKGEYRIALEGTSEPVEAPPADHAAVPARSFFARPVGVAVVAVIGIVVGIALDRTLMSDGGSAAPGYQAVAASALWDPVTGDDAPVTIVVGDYFIFGELDEAGNIGRLVREFSINSSRDLDERFMMDPDATGRYIDLDLTYLPSSIASAMRDLVGVLSAAGKEIRVVAMSNLETSVIREGHTVYVGYLSGLGMLQDFLFADSSLAVGDTFDEIVNRQTGERYISEAGFPSGQRSYRDYGLFSTRPAPGGHRFVFVAGTRDEGLMQTARAISDPEIVARSLEAVRVDGAPPAAFELLYEVAGLGRTSLDAMIVHAAPLGDDELTITRLTR